jgi:uncharacterized membrane protein
MDLEFALLTFTGINSAAEAFAQARGRSSSSAPWTSEVGFVEHHDNGKLVLRGTFAGHYVDVDEALHVSERGAAEGWAAGALIGAALGGPLGFALGVVGGPILGSQLGKPSETDPEPGTLADQLRSAVPPGASAIVLIADSHDVDELIAAADDASAQVMRRVLTPDEAAAVQAALSATPTASAGPSQQGEEAVESSEA